MKGVFKGGVFCPSKGRAGRQKLGGVGVKGGVGQEEKRLARGEKDAWMKAREGGNGG